MMKAFLLSLALLVLGSGQLVAQQPVQTWAAPVSVATNASNRITATGTFQKIFDATMPTTQVRRTDCVVQNLVTSTLVRPMWVFFGSTTPTTATSLRLDSSQIFHCNTGGAALQDKISITGTSGDEFFAIQQ